MPLGDSGINPGLAASNPALELQNAVRRGQSFSGHERHVVFKNTEANGFEEIPAITGLDIADDGRAACFTDWDGDGDLDLWVNNRSGPQLRFFDNQNPQGKPGISVRLIGTDCNRDAIGARVALKLKDQPVQLRSVTAGDGFLAQSTKALLFSGTPDDIELLTIHWPGQSEPQLIRELPAASVIITQNATEVLPFHFTAPTAIDTPQPPSLPPAARTLLAQPLPIATLFDRPEDSEGKPLLISLTDDQHAPDVAPGIVLQQHDIETLRREAPARLRTLQIARDHLFDIMDRADPTPLSLLIDSKDKLRAIYFGRFKPEQLRSDLQQLTDADAETDNDPRNRSLPFPGHWISKSTPSARPLSLAEDLIDAGLLDAARRYVEHYTDLLQGDPLYRELIGRLNLEMRTR